MHIHILNTLKRNPMNKDQIDSQKSALLTRALVLHLLKSVYLLSRVTFDKRAFWERDAIAPECSVYEQSALD